VYDDGVLELFTRLYAEQATARKDLEIKKDLESALESLGREMSLDPVGWLDFISLVTSGFFPLPPHTMAMLPEINALVHERSELEIKDNSTTGSPMLDEIEVDQDTIFDTSDPNP